MRALLAIFSFVFVSSTSVLANEDAVRLRFQKFVLSGADTFSTARVEQTARNVDYIISMLDTCLRSGNCAQMIVEQLSYLDHKMHYEEMDRDHGMLDHAIATTQDESFKARAFDADDYFLGKLQEKRNSLKALDRENTLRLEKACESKKAKKFLNCLLKRKARFLRTVYKEVTRRANLDAVTDGLSAITSLDPRFGPIGAEKTIPHGNLIAECDPYALASDWIQTRMVINVRTGRGTAQIKKSDHPMNGGSGDVDFKDVPKFNVTLSQKSNANTLVYEGKDFEITLDLSKTEERYHKPMYVGKIETPLNTMLSFSTWCEFSWNN